MVFLTVKQCFGYNASEAFVQQRFYKTGINKTELCPLRKALKRYVPFWNLRTNFNIKRMNNLFCFIKFGRKEHLDSLIQNGKMRFGPIDSFAQSKEKERGDKYEGAYNIINEQFSKIECDHPEYGKFTFNPVPNKIGTLIEFIDEPFYCYSLYSLTSECFKETDKHKIDKRMIEFGDYALVISEPNIFLERIKKKLIDSNIIFSYKLIEYKDYNQVGAINTNLFTKTKELQHQLEYRILIKTQKKENEIFLEIGSLEDICFLSKTEELLKVEFKARRESIKK